MTDIHAPDPERPELHPDQECCQGLIKRRKRLVDLAMEVHLRPPMILRLRERWRVSSR